MVLILVGIVIGILVIAVLIVKAIKTSPREMLGVNIQCKQCGHQTNGLRCPNCKKGSQFGV